MAKQTINIGTVANDRSGDPLRTAFTKVNQNFTELYNKDATDFSGNYNDLSNKPNLNLYQLASTAFSGDYDDLDNKPTISNFVNEDDDLVLPGSLVFPDSTTQTTAFSAIPNVEGIIIGGLLKESIVEKTNAGVVTYDCSEASVFFHASPSVDWTVNLVNFGLDDDYSTTITIIIDQFDPGHHPSVLQIDGNAQTIRWHGGVEPTPSTFAIDIVSFKIFKLSGGGGYSVIGQLTGVVPEAGETTQPYLELTNDALITIPTTLGQSVTVTAEPAGSSAAFTVVIAEGPVVESVTATTAGTNYVVGQRYKIGYGQIGGNTESDSLIFTINTVNGSGGILTVANTEFVGVADNTPGSYTGQNADYIPSVFDAIDTGLTLTRDNQRALFNIEEEAQYDNNLHLSPLGTSWNSDGWGDLSNVRSRSYTTLRESLNGAIGENIIDAELVMHDTINDKFYKFNFSAWGQDNAGGFAYVRNLIDEPNYFAKTDYGNEIDIFVADDGNGAGIGITRGNNNGIYNPYREEGWDNNVSPDGTLWNIDGWNDLSNVETRTYLPFNDAYGGALGNRVPGSQSIMYIPETEEYYAIQWINWTQNNAGGGFSYIRKKIDLTEINEGIRFSDGTVLKSAADVVGRVKSTASSRRRIEEVYGEKTVYLSQAVTTNLSTVPSREVTNGSRIFISTSGTTIDDILDSPGTYDITDTNTIQFSIDNNIWYVWDGSVTYPNEGEVSYGLRGFSSLTYGEGDTVYFRYKTGGAPVVWWDKTDLPSGGGDFRGAVIDYHAFTGEATWIGTIHIVDDDGEEHITHTEVSSGSTDAENDDLWLVQNEGTISYRRIDGESKTLKVHWSAKVFYGSDIYD